MEMGLPFVGYTTPSTQRQTTWTDLEAAPVLAAVAVCTEPSTLHLKV
jgi:hypothetical protein